MTSFISRGPRRKDAALTQRGRNRGTIGKGSYLRNKYVIMQSLKKYTGGGHSEFEEGDD